MNEFDIVIVGSGITGAIMANKLSQAGFNVLIMDAGKDVYFDVETGKDKRQGLIDAYIESALKRENAPYPNLQYAPSPNTPTDYYVQDTKTKFQSTYTRVVGGSTYHWLGSAFRYEPNSFREKSAYGVAIDWPIRYEDLQDWYWMAEVEIGVAGDESSLAAGARRPDQRYPMPPIAMSYSDRRIQSRTRGLSYEGLPIQIEITPQARNSVLYEDRPACAGSSTCIPICPIQAKYDATVHLKRALNPKLDPTNSSQSRAAQSRFGCVLTRVLVDASGNVCGLTYKRPDTKEEGTVTAKIYILAMHAVEIPKVLLYSTGSSSSGVANSSDMVGRHLMDHDVRIAWSLADEPLYQHRGPMSSSGIESLRDGEFRKDRSAFRIQLQNGGTRWSMGAPFTTLMDLLDQGIIGDELRRRLAWNATRQLELDALLEPIPDPENRVTLSDVPDELGIPRPKLNYQIGEYTLKGAQAFEDVARKVMGAMGAKDSDVHILPEFFGAGHVMGTHRMGDSPNNSVTDSFGKTHDHPNLFLAGCGLLPTISTVNPTLTITALALRTADLIQREFSRY